MKGFCPSSDDHAQGRPRGCRRWHEEEEGPPARARSRAARPVFKVDTDNFGAHVMGIGGTGSVTVAATIANAARIDGKAP